MGVPHGKRRVSMIREYTILLDFVSLQEPGRQIGAKLRMTHTKKKLSQTAYTTT